MLMLVYFWEERENWHFLVFVSQPIIFRLLKKPTSCSAWFIFPCLIPHFLAKYSSHSLVHWQRSWQSRRLIKRGSQPLVKRFKNSPNSYSRLSESNITLISMYCKIFTQSAPKYSDVMYAALNTHVCCFEYSITHVGMYDVDVCSVHLSECVHFA